MYKSFRITSCAEKYGIVCSLNLLQNTCLNHFHVLSFSSEPNIGKRYVGDLCQYYMYIFFKESVACEYFLIVVIVVCFIPVIVGN